MRVSCAPAATTNAARMDISDLPQTSEAPILRSTNPLVQWLWHEGWAIASLPPLSRGLGRAMVAAGIPVMRLRLTLRTMHPQLAGFSHSWLRDGDTVEEFWPPLFALHEDTFLKSPSALLLQGAGAVRHRLDIPGATLDFPILEELRAQGATDYVALPMVFADGRINVMTLATDRPGGFTTAELRTVAEMLPVLARLMEMHALRRTAKTVLETYLGHLTGERVLDGLIHRGEGEDIHAVIWLCDLRGSTPLADKLSHRAFLELLNDYFECMAGAVLAHRGEVLKFIGDAMLAIFPISAVTDHPERCPEHVRACRDAIAAAGDAMHRMANLNRQRAERRKPPLRFGIALHLGDVMYGNLGAPGRLDFTVIGPAVNEAARLETMCKRLVQPLVISAEVARVLPQPLVSLGVHALRGVRRRHELFTLAEVGSFAGEGEILPKDRHRYSPVAGFRHAGHDFAQFPAVPVDNDGGEQVERRDLVVLAVAGAITNLRRGEQGALDPADLAKRHGQPVLARIGGELRNTGLGTTAPGRHVVEAAARRVSFPRSIGRRSGRRPVAGVRVVSLGINTYSGLSARSRMRGAKRKPRIEQAANT